MATQHFDYRFITESAKNIILHPKDEWENISAQKISNKELILFYAVPLVAVASLIRLFSVWLGTYLTFSFALKVAVLQFIQPVATIVVTAILVNELSETFNSKKNLTSAFKLIVYSYTPWLVANIIASISWSLSWVIIFGLYGIYLLWLGISVLMNTPEGEKPIYTLAVTVITLLVNLILGFILNIDRLA